MLILRDYQSKAIAALYAWLSTNAGNPLVVAPTGSGKSLLIAKMVQDVVAEGGRVLCLAHVKELIRQNADEIRGLCPELEVGIYSAGLKQRNTTARVIVAGIASVYKRAGELDRFDLILVDECHMIQPEGTGMYRRFIADSLLINPNIRIVGMTATPFRLDCGYVYGDDMLFKSVAYEIPINELIVRGFLCPVSSKASKHEFDVSKVAIQGGEFVNEEVDILVNTDEAVRDAVAEVVAKSHDRNKVLIFANSVKHAHNIVAEFQQNHGLECGIVTGESMDRDLMLRRFDGRKSGDLIGDTEPELKYLVNVNVLTIGYNCKTVDLIALMRATMSPGLYMQMVGRGLRIHPPKTNCLLLDFGQNIKRHGPIDDIRVRTPEDGEDGTAPIKFCPDCDEACHAACLECPECGFEFPPPVKPMTKAASKAAALATERAVVDVTLDVKDARYFLHRKKGADESAPYTLRVDYSVGNIGMVRSEWVCFEHDGYARNKAVNWWRARSHDPCPHTVKRALEVIEDGGIAPTLTITVREKEGSKFPEIIAYTIGEIPPRVDDASLPAVMALANVRRSGEAADDQEPDDGVNVVETYGTNDIPFGFIIGLIATLLGGMA